VRRAGRHEQRRPEHQAWPPDSPAGRKVTYRGSPEDAKAGLSRLTGSTEPAGRALDAATRSPDPDGRQAHGHGPLNDAERQDYARTPAGERHGAFRPLQEASDLIAEYSRLP
jgi:hypothetical protein